MGKKELEDYMVYIMKYCTKHNIDPEEAEKHMLVRMYKEYLNLGKGELNDKSQ